MILPFAFFASYEIQNLVDEEEILKASRDFNWIVPTSTAVGDSRIIKTKQEMNNNWVYKEGGNFHKKNARKSRNREKERCTEWSK